MIRKYQLSGPSGGEKAEDLLEQCQDNQEAIQRLQALLSEWLRMENLVVLTAAGCSVEACCGKTMDGLETAVLKAVKEVPATLGNEKSGLSDKVKKLIDERLKEGEKADWAKTGFEQWLSYLVNAVHLATKQDSPIKSLTWKGAEIASFSGVGDVIGSKGLFCSLYADRGSHYWHTPEAGGKVDKTNPTQFGRALTQLGIDTVLFTRGARPLRTHVWHASKAITPGTAVKRYHDNGII